MNEYLKNPSFQNQQREYLLNLETDDNSNSLNIFKKFDIYKDISKLSSEIKGIG